MGGRRIPEQRSGVAELDREPVSYLFRCPADVRQENAESAAGHGSRRRRRGAAGDECIGISPAWVPGVHRLPAPVFEGCMLLVGPGQRPMGLSRAPIGVNDLEWLVGKVEEL